MSIKGLRASAPPPLTHTFTAQFLILYRLFPPAPLPDNELILKCPVFGSHYNIVREQERHKECPTGKTWFRIWRVTDRWISIGVIKINWSEICNRNKLLRLLYKPLRSQCLSLISTDLHFLLISHVLDFLCVLIIVTLQMANGQLKKALVLLPLIYRCCRLLLNEENCRPYNRKHWKCLLFL